LETLEWKLKAKEKIEHGFDLIGLEQLRIENRKMGKNNLDRENDLRKLRAKQEATGASTSRPRHDITTMTEEIEVDRRLLHELDRSIARHQKEFSSLIRNGIKFKQTRNGKLTRLVIQSSGKIIVCPNLKSKRCTSALILSIHAITILLLLIDTTIF